MARTAYQDGTAELIVRLLNGEGELIDADATPTVDIFPPGSDPRSASTVDGDALLLAQSATRVEKGIYKYSYSVAVDATEGTYYDRWKWTVDGTAQEYTFLRNHVNWGEVSEFAAVHSLKNSLFSVCAEYNNEIIGMGRVVGDGYLYFYVQDIIVYEKYRGQGIATKIMGMIMEYITSKAEKGSVIGLMSAKGVEKFYKKFGFFERPDEKFGAGMMKFI